MRAAIRIGWVALLALAISTASSAKAGEGADRSVTLRLATIAPEGTAWARELRAFARETERSTEGAVKIKWYFGAIAGDELQMGDRIRRGQLDGAASGGPLCEQVAPSLRVLRVLGLITGHREAAYVAGRLRSQLVAEAQSRGMALLGIAPVGPHVIFSRRPIRSMAELKKLRVWVWDRDDVMRLELRNFGVPLSPMPIDQAAAAYDQGRIDGFIAPPSVALAFQWSAQARYVSDLRMDMISGCVLLSDRAFDPLSVDAKKAIASAGAKLSVRFEDVGAEEDAQLLGGLFARQGVTTVPVDATFAAEFFALAQSVRDRLGDALVPKPLMLRVQAILADYRAENH
ncbi:MAG: TRAP transporter substrate-binding protein DctP [Polyangia bacterium]